MPQVPDMPPVVGQRLQGRFVPGPGIELAHVPGERAVDDSVQVGRGGPRATGLSSGCSKRAAMGQE